MGSQTTCDWPTDHWWSADHRLGNTVLDANENGEKTYFDDTIINFKLNKKIY